MVLNENSPSARTKREREREASPWKREMTSTKRVLMLHGYMQSDHIFRAKTGGLRKSLAKLGYELFYACGPEVVNVQESSDTTTDDGRAYGWWNKQEQLNGRDDYEIDASVLAYLRKYVLDNGPFDGLVGFSQGASLAGYLATGFNEILNLTEIQQPPLRFLIAFSGFKLLPERFQQAFDKGPIDIPSLHVVGELDSVVSESRSMQLLNACSKDTRTLLRHPGGHFVPNAKIQASQITNWLQKVDNIQQHQSSQAFSANKTPAMDDDLLDMIDSMGKL